MCPNLHSPGSLLIFFNCLTVRPFFEGNVSLAGGQAKGTEENPDGQARISSTELNKQRADPEEAVQGSQKFPLWFPIQIGVLGTWLRSHM